MGYYHINEDNYIEFGKAILTQLGVERSHAQIQMESLLDADLKGTSTHGLYRLSRYIDQLKREDVTPNPHITKEETRNGNIVLMDGDHGLGAVNGYYGMNQAVTMSKRNGLGMVTIRNSNHFGAAGYFSEIAAKNEQIGIVFSNSSPSIAPTGSKKPVLGNNPWSISVPTNKGYCITLDVSNGKVAKGKIRLAKENNEEIPDGWALNMEGMPTNDPIEALKGIILPVGDHKGYGITLMIEILAGVLTGSDFGLNMVNVDEKGKRNVGHFMLSVDINSLMDTAEYYRRIDQLVDMIKSAPAIKEGDNIFLPGEMEYKQKQKHTGKVPVAVKTMERIVRKCNDLSIEISETELCKEYLSKMESVKKGDSE